MQLPTTRRESTDARSRGGNGGFPEPRAGEPVRVVRCAHRECGAETRIRLPAALPERAVHRVVCDGCHQPYDPPAAAGGGRNPLEPARRVALGGWDRLLDGRDAFAERLRRIDKAQLWTWASVPIAALAVVAGLALIQGDADEALPPATVAPAGARGPQAEYLKGAGYSLALPAGWEETTPPDGAAFAAHSKDGLADATLWIEDDPNLSFDEFEERSLAQLEEIGENPRLVDRVQGSTIESTIVELTAESPVADGVTAPIRVTLRAAGDYRLYFSTLVQPGADPQLAADVETLHASIRPEVELEGVDTEATE